MTSPTNYVCFHKSLGVEFQGVEELQYGSTVVQFRGIPYGKITERFAKPVPFEFSSKNVDATTFGPLCPQPQVDTGHLLRLPPASAGTKATFDEFKCLNLNIHCPPIQNTTKSLPVIVWIHGGSQVMTFTSATDPVCDPSRLVAQSIKAEHPVIFVSVNYRLNVFAFGDGTGERNLALQDQKLAVEWLIQNIIDFGGDNRNITLAGESAGAVYVHAHTLTGTPIQRAIMASGSLHLSPPLPIVFGNQLITKIADKLDGEEAGQTLRIASVSSLVKALTSCQINSMWLQEDEAFKGWRDKPESVESIMIGDVEFESIIWRNGIEQMSADQIVDSFIAAGEHSNTLMQLYHVNSTRSTQSKLAALDFLSDARFALPAYSVAKRWKSDKKRIYQYVLDQTNPWQSSSRAHHAVDLILLFGGADFSSNTGAEVVGEALRRSWILFANGEDPWESGKRFAFGPLGSCGVLNEEGYAQRRRVKCLEHLHQIPLDVINAVFGRLATGRISLLN